MEVTVTRAEQDSRARRRGATRGLSREAGAASMGAGRESVTQVIGAPARHLRAAGWSRFIQDEL